MINFLSVFANIEICLRLNLSFDHLEDLLIKDCLYLLLEISFINFFLVPLGSKNDLSLFQKLFTII